MSSVHPACPLCSNASEELIADYFRCPVCDLRFLDPRLRLDSKAEKDRYLLHENNFEDPRYRNFLMPLAQAVRSQKMPPARGLDFGSGPAPVLADILRKMGFEMFVHDPFFHSDAEVFARQYDFICASEVAEHFFDPFAELEKLRACLRPKGLLAIMTALYLPEIDFASWYYRKDPTHVVFYSPKTFAWIKTRFLFGSLEIQGDRIAVLSL